jgi:4-hydroxy-4-methyl-2-oxoglutarate aldolase
MRSTRIVPKEAALLIDGPFIEGRRPGQPAGPEAEGLAERLQRLYTGIIFDVMRALAIAPGVLPPNISALDPSLKLAGPVWTVHGHLVEGAVPHDTLLSWTRMLSAAPPGSVVVCQPENQEIALMGELSSEALKSRGVRGYVVDGGCRDTAFIRRLGFPVYCRFTTPRDIVGRWLTDELGGSVRIGAVTVSTGRLSSGGPGWGGGGARVTGPWRSWRRRRRPPGWKTRCAPRSWTVRRSRTGVPAVREVLGGWQVRPRWAGRRSPAAAAPGRRLPGGRPPHPGGRDRCLMEGSPLSQVAVDTCPSGTRSRRGPLGAGELVRKCGAVIGRTSCPRGRRCSYLHLHNLQQQLPRRPPRRGGQRGRGRRLP